MQGENECHEVQGLKVMDSSRAEEHRAESGWVMRESTEGPEEQGWCCRFPSNGI